MDERSAKWHRMTPNDVAQKLHTDVACGLSPKAARARIKRYGFNTLFDAHHSHSGKNRILRMLLPDSACILMIGTALLSLFFTDPGTVLIGIVAGGVPLSLLVFILLRVKGTYEEIEKYRIPHVTVLRGSRILSVSARRIVRGDVVLLKAGDIVPADCRLIRSTELRVLTLMPNEKGSPFYKELPKCADTVYPYGSTVSAPTVENMLYGGSEILCGEARAIVVEVGKFTYIGALSTFPIPAEVHAGESGEEATKELRGYLRVYGFIMLALLLALTIVGVLTAPSDVGILDVFYPLCVLCGVASPALLMLYFRCCALRETVALMHLMPEENRTALKVGRTTDRLSRATDLFLLGHKACSDGLLHFHSAFVGGTVYKPAKEDVEYDAMHDLCEAFALKKHSSAGLTSALGVLGTEEDQFLEELIEESHFDLDAMQIRLVRAEERRGEENGVHCIEVQTNSNRFSLFFSNDWHVVERCRDYEDHGHLCRISEEIKLSLREYCEEAKANACHVITVVRKGAEGGLSLVGAVSMRERVQPSLKREIDSLERSGVRLSFFLSGEADYENAFCDVCGLSDLRIVCSKEFPHLTHELLHSHRVFIGYSNDEILTVLREIQKRRHTVGVLCGNVEDRRFLNAAAFTVACDSRLYQKKETEECGGADSFSDGREYSAHASQSMRRHADAVISRATPNHGGLAALSEFFFASRSVGLRMRFLLSYAISVNMLRIFFAIFCSLTGVGLPSGAWMLYSCLLLDVLALRWIASLRIPRGYLKEIHRIDEETVDTQIFSLARWLPLLISVGVVSLYLAILRWLDVITQDAAHAPLLLLFLAVQLWMLHSSVTLDGVLKRHSRISHPGVAMLAPLVVLIPLSILVPAVGEFTSLGDWHLAAIAAIPLFPAVYFLARYFVAFFHRTAK